MQIFIQYMQSTRKKVCLLLCFSMLSAAAFAQHRPKERTERRAGNIQVFPVDPLQKVFRETAFFPDLSPAADVAKGEYASFQFAVRSVFPIRRLRAHIVSGSNFIAANATTGFVGYVRIGRTIPNPPVDKLISPSGFFPDPILDTPYVNVPAACTQPVWLTIAVPRDIAAGDYKGTLILQGEVNGKEFGYRQPFTVKVYPVTIDSSSLWVTNWYKFNYQIWRLMNNGDSVTPYSPLYWHLLNVFARKMAAYRQNVVLIPVLELTQYQRNGTEYQFDFSRFDQYVQLFSQAGALKRIEGGHIGGRMGTWESNFGVSVPYMNGDTLKFKKYLADDSAAVRFYSQFLPALVRHLREKGWDKIYMQHLADEPTDGNYASYIAIAKLFRQYAPGIPVIDACHTHKLDNTVNIWVPELDFLSKDYPFYQQRQQKGDEVWFYTCLAPQGNFANRFIELPLIKTRILHWINFRYGITGYLHWGFDFWNDHPFDETSGINLEGGNILPAGDSYIVYPGYHKLYSSIRLEAMRDGIDDYTLLEMLSRKNPARAKELCRQVVYRFDWYDTDIKAFREKRKRLLQWLSQ